MAPQFEAIRPGSTLRLACCAGLLGLSALACTAEIAGSRGDGPGTPGIDGPGSVALGPDGLPLAGSSGASGIGGGAPTNPKADPAMTGEPGVRVPDANIACVDGADPTISARLWRLTRVQLENSLRSAYHALVPRVDEPLKGLVVPFGTSNSADRFSTRARSYGLDEPSFRDLMNAAGATSRSLVSDLGSEACVGAGDFSGCVSGLVARLVSSFLDAL